MAVILTMYNKVQVCVCGGGGGSTMAHYTLVSLVSVVASESMKEFFPNLKTHVELKKSMWPVTLI